MVMSRVYAFANQKGGVGKTTTAISLGAYLAAAGRRVLIVDADPQANATSSLGVDWNSLDRSLYDVLVRGVPVADIIIPIEQPPLALVPSVPELAGAEVEMVGMLARERLLSAALEPVISAYDYIFIDTPPAWGC